MASDKERYEALVDEMREVLGENEWLRGRLSEIEEAYRITVDDGGAADEAHCSCVPFLRLEIERLRGELSVEKIAVANLEMRLKHHKKP
jgi:hypothetical protein